jgi:16S rRNA U1498 N3-methylase RsmE
MLHYFVGVCSGSSDSLFSVLQALTKGDRARRNAIELVTEAGVDHVIPWNAFSLHWAMEGRG